MILVLEDRYEPFLSIGINNVPVPTIWRQKWRVDHTIVTKINFTNFLQN